MKFYLHIEGREKKVDCTGSEIPRSGEKIFIKIDKEQLELIVYKISHTIAFSEMHNSFQTKDIIVNCREKTKSI